MAADPLIQEILGLLSLGQADQARVQAQSRDTKAIADYSLHLAWADLLEELDLMDEVILELNLAIRDDPDREETYARLAEIYLDQGKPLKAAHLWGRL